MIINGWINDGINDGNPSILYLSPPLIPLRPTPPSATRCAPVRTRVAGKLATIPVTAFYGWPPSAPADYQRRRTESPRSQCQHSTSPGIPAAPASPSGSAHTHPTSSQGRLERLDLERPKGREPRTEDAPLPRHRGRNASKGNLGPQTAKFRFIPSFRYHTITSPSKRALDGKESQRGPIPQRIEMTYPLKCPVFGLKACSRPYNF